MEDCAEEDKISLQEILIAPPILSSLAVLAAISNLTSFYYIKKTYNTQQSLYFIFASDSALTCLGFCLQAISLFIISFSVRTAEICTLLQTSELLVSCLCLICTFLIALIKCLKLTKPLLIPNHKENTVKFVSTIVIIIFCLYIIAIGVINSALDLKALHVYCFCIKNHGGHSYLIALIGLDLPLVFLAIVTAILDLTNMILVVKFHRQMECVALYSSLIRYKIKNSKYKNVFLSISLIFLALA